MEAAVIMVMAVMAARVAVAERDQYWYGHEERRRRTMVQNSMILRHQIIHFPTSEGMSEVSERANE